MMGMINRQVENAFRVVLALLVLAAGMAMLAVNLGFLDGDLGTIWRLLYPSVFIAYGLKLTAESLATMAVGHGFDLRWLWGLTLAVLGALLILGTLAYIDFTLGMVTRLWPILLVYIGLSLLFDRGATLRRSHIRVSTDGGPGARDPGDETHGARAESGRHYGRRSFVEDANFSRANWSVEPTDLDAVVADYRFDFTRAFIPEGETPFILTGWVGDVTIVVPRDIEFSICARGLVGDMRVAEQTRDGFNLSLSYKTSGFEEATTRLVFEVDYRVLDLRLDRV